MSIASPPERALQEELGRGLPLAPGKSKKSLADRGDWWFMAGCLVCGTWVLGAIGAAMMLFGAYLLRKAQKLGHAIRPWSVTIIGGLVLVDAAVNGLAWGIDLLAPHTLIGRSLWIDYGLAWDGGYSLFYNSQGIGGPGLQGVANHGEKAVQVATVFLVMPMKGMAAWGFLKMKRWGLQWIIIANWLYVCLWVIYAANMSFSFDWRFGTSDFGVLGFWLMAGIPFCGPMILLPYLHTVNRELWNK
jgi:hypothetical protein